MAEDRIISSYAYRRGNVFAHIPPDSVELYHSMGQEIWRIEYVRVTDVEAEIEAINRMREG